MTGMPTIPNKRSAIAKLLTALLRFFRDFVFCLRQPTKITMPFPIIVITKVIIETAAVIQNKTLKGVVAFTSSPVRILAKSFAV